MTTLKSNILYFFRSLINLFKVSISKDIENLYLPNFFIRNKIFINPNQIKYIQSVPMKFHGNTKLIIDFDWDKKKKKVKDEENLDYKFLICNDFNNRIEHENDDLFILEKENFDQYKNLYDFKKEETIENYLKDKLRLFISIKKAGLKSIFNNNIQFMIDRDLNLVKINSGDHRFFISRILGLKKIPVEIKLIHANCIQDHLNKKKLLDNVNELIQQVENKYN